MIVLSVFTLCVSFVFSDFPTDIGVGDDDCSLKNEYSTIKEIEFQYCERNTSYKLYEKYEQRIWEVDGIEFPEGIQTSRQIEIPSKEMSDLQTHLILTLAAFNELCEEIDILYSITCGNLISYYRDDRIILPWDDDIDITVQKEGFQKLISMFNQLEKSHTSENWDIRIKFTENYTLALSRPMEKKLNSNSWWMKMNILSPTLKFPIGFRGFFRHSLDILKCDDNNLWNPPVENLVRNPKMNLVCGGFYIDGGISQGPRSFETKEDYPIVEMCGIKTRAPKKEAAAKWIREGYGEEPLEMKKHPDLQRL